MLWLMEAVATWSIANELEIELQVCSERLVDLVSDGIRLLRDGSEGLSG